MAGFFDGITNFFTQDPASAGTASTNSLYDPRIMMLLGASQGLLKAGQPSPYPTGLGGALSGGLQGALSGAMQAEQLKQAGTLNDYRKAQVDELKRKAAVEEENRRIRSMMFPGLTAPTGAVPPGVPGVPATQGALSMAGDPERIEQLGTYLALTGDAGAATLLNVAERLRTAQQNRRAVEGMRSAPGVLGAGVTTTSPQGQALLGNLSGDQGFDSAVLAAQNESLNSNPNLTPQPIQAPRPGLFGPLLTSPYVGPFAQQYQQQLDAPSSTGLKAQDWTDMANRLQQQHVTSTNQATARGENAELRRDLADQADNTRRMLAAVSRQGRTDRQQDLQDQREFNRERSLANDYNRLVADFRTVLPAFTSTARYVAGGEYNSSGDRDLAFAFARTLDPKDRVGVRDIADINKLGNLPERMQQAIVALAQGKELPERVRLEMFAAMRNRFEAMNEQQQQIEDEYEGRAQQYMLKPDRIVQRFAIRTQKPSGTGATGGWSAREKK